MIRGKCEREGCMFRTRSGACDFLLITGRPRECDIKDCDQYIEGEKAVPRSEWVGSRRKYEGKIEIECETKGLDEAAEEIEEEIERIGDAIVDFPPQVTVRNCDGCTINIYASQYPVMREVEEDE